MIVSLLILIAIWGISVGVIWLILAASFGHRPASGRLASGRAARATISMLLGTVVAVAGSVAYFSSILN